MNHRKILNKTAKVLTLALVVAMFSMVNFTMGKLTRLTNLAGNANINAVIHSNSISPNGRFVTYSTNATNVTGDPTQKAQIVVLDRLTGATAIASTSNNGTLGASDSYEPSISDPIGSNCDVNPNSCHIRVAFQSKSENLLVVKGDGGRQKIFITELTLNFQGTTSPREIIIASKTGSNSAPALAPGQSDDPKISGNGEYIFFVNGSKDLIVAYPSGIPNLFRKRIIFGSVDNEAAIAISNSFNCPPVNGVPDVCVDGSNRYPAPNYFGTKVVWQSAATQLIAPCPSPVPGGTSCVNVQTQNRLQAYYREISPSGVLGTTELISSTTNNSSTEINPASQGCGPVSSVSFADISDDGGKVVFVCSAVNLGGNNDSLNKMFTRIRNGNGGGVTKLSYDNTINNHQLDPNISRDGRFISLNHQLNRPVFTDSVINSPFISSQTFPDNFASQLVAGGNLDSSGNGRFSIFFTNRVLDPSDPNNADDIYLYDRLAPPAMQSSGDFNGDGVTDLSVFRDSNTRWYSLLSPNQVFNENIFGQSADKLVSGDYDGDGKTDRAVRRGSTWQTQSSLTTNVTTTNYGLSTDIPVAADYDGDGKSDIAVFRPSNGTWYWKNSSNGVDSGVQFGSANAGADRDIPVPGDYNKDGKTDLGVFRPATGIWYIYLTTTTPNVYTFSALQFGVNGDIPIQSDFNGDGKTDIAVVRKQPSNSNCPLAWYYINLDGSNFSSSCFGFDTDLPIPGDYDNDGKSDIAVYRAGQWFALSSSNGNLISNFFGNVSDRPIPWSNISNQ